MTKDKIKSIVAFLIGIAMLIFFFIGPVIAMSNLYSARMAEAWPTTSGIVTQSNWTYGRKGSHLIHFEYSYTVDGREYTGDRYMFHSTWLYGNRQTNRIVSENPVGSQVTVHYLSQAPAESVLVPGKISSDLWLVMYTSLPFGLLVLFFMVAVVWFNLTRTPEQKARDKARWDQVQTMRDQFNSNRPVDFMGMVDSEQLSNRSIDYSALRRKYNYVRVVILIIGVGLILLGYFN